MTAIITGDIINSRETQPNEWMPLLKETLGLYGSSPSHWEIYRGDSFQLEVSPDKAVQAAINIKASIKQLTKIDVRLAIGLGNKTYATKRISESNGGAFINSGECFEALKKNTLALKSEYTDLDTTMNLMFELALLTMNNWTPTAAKLFKMALQNNHLNQQELATANNTTQSNISQGLKRAGYDEISKLMAYYKIQINAL